MTREVAISLPRDTPPTPLLAYLCARFTYHTRDEWSQRIAAGDLSLNDTKATPEAILHPGDRLIYTPSLPEPPVDFAWHVLFEDDTLLVINKPANLPVHPAGRYFNHTLWAALQEAGYAAPYFVNRLDRETSGIILCAKSAAAVPELTRAIQSKVYRAIVHGHYPEGTPRIYAGTLQADTASAIRKKRQLTGLHELAACPPPQDIAPSDAITELCALRSSPHYTEVQARLYTGRLHQIRATLLALGYPIAGDKIYGRDETLFLRFLDDAMTPEDHTYLTRFPRQMLHAAELTLTRPNSTPQTFIAPPPPDFYLEP